MSKGRSIPLNLLAKLGEAATANTRTRNFLLNQLDQKMYKDLIIGNPDNRPLKVQEDKYAMGQALTHSIRKGLEKGNLSRKAAKGLLSVFLGNVFFGGFYKRREFIDKHGFKPPIFITISPTGACNLKCTGCYEASTPSLGKLSFATFDRIIKDAKESWGANFFVISGGEPLMYKSDGKTFLDIARIHSDCFFLMYTNGTMIDKSMAKTLADLGNITPSISVEGLKEETDKRRGAGVFKKICQAMENLRETGVPFGISITAFNHNVDLIVSKKFTNFYFEEQGAMYGWIFHYMPIGRGFTLEALPTPEQRVKLLHNIWDLVRDKKIFLADFWNSAAASDGCICAARGGGYFYIDWDGNIMPCVFVPYSVDNINDLYKKGDSLETAINSPFFKSLRKWQANYGYEQPADKVSNWFVPCPIRDHYADMYDIVTSTNARPLNPQAEEALADKDYRQGLIKYGKDVDSLTRESWEKEYLAKG
jgi:MoaA/NifB/PqqE/SkfB family radical SAM enzyme